MAGSGKPGCVAVPAVLADHYILVMEPDKVSVDQIGGFQESIREFESRFRLRSHFGGFIINKATFSPTDTTFEEGLARLYNAGTIGTIPADYDCMRAYQTKEVPSQVFPYSDFAFHAFKTIDCLIAPQHNWSDEEQKPWNEAFTSVRSGWLGRMRLQWIQDHAPMLQIVVGLVAVLSYGLYVYVQDTAFLQVIYFAGAVLFTWSLVTGLLSLQKWLLRIRASRGVRIGTAGFGAAIVTACIGLVVAGVPATFSQNILVKRINEQDKLIGRLTQTAFLGRDYRTRLNFVLRDLDQADQLTLTALKSIGNDLPTMGGKDLCVSPDFLAPVSNQLTTARTVVQRASTSLNELSSVIDATKAGQVKE
jgi:hypothetical protein